MSVRKFILTDMDSGDTYEFQTRAKARYFADQTRKKRAATGGTARFRCIRRSDVEVSIEPPRWAPAKVVR